jgi:hypothetical protein
VLPNSQTIWKPGKICQTIFNAKMLALGDFAAEGFAPEGFVPEGGFAPVNLW